MSKKSQEGNLTEQKGEQLLHIALIILVTVTVAGFAYIFYWFCLSPK